MPSRKPLIAPPDQETEDWFSHPVTQYFAGLIALDFDIAEDGLRQQGCVAESAEHLMADRANLFGILTTVERYHEVFQSKSLAIMEEGNEEHIRDLPERGSDTGETGPDSEGSD